MILAPEKATEFGIKLFCSPDGEEQTKVSYNTQKCEFVVDFEQSSTDKTLEYPQNVTRQVVPCDAAGRVLELDIFVDRSVTEIFVNSDIVLVQRVYPTRDDSRQFKVFSSDGLLNVTDIVKWEMDAANLW